MAFRVEARYIEKSSIYVFGLFLMRKFNSGEHYAVLGFSVVLTYLERRLGMAYVVTQHCVDCKYSDCVTVCPVDAFHEGPRMLYINPDTCVNCDACVPACPVEAIYSEENLPNKYSHYMKINAEGASGHPVLNYKKDPLSSAKSLEELKEMDEKGYVPPGFPAPSE